MAGISRDHLGASEDIGAVLSVDITQISLTLEEGLESGNNWI